MSAIDHFEIHVRQGCLFILKFVSSMMFVNQFKEFKYYFVGLVYLLIFITAFRWEFSIEVIFKVISIKGIGRSRKASIFDLLPHYLSYLLSQFSDINNNNYLLKAKNVPGIVLHHTEAFTPHIQQFYQVDLIPFHSKPRLSQRGGVYRAGEQTWQIQDMETRLLSLCPPPNTTT